MHRITGRTFENKERLKEIGARWNPDANAWEKEYISDIDRAIIRSMVGVSIAENPNVQEHRPLPRPVKPSESIETILRRILETQQGNRKPGKTLIFGDDRTWLNCFADQNPVAFFGFSSLQQMVKYVEAIPLDHQTGAGWKVTAGSFHGTTDMQEALTLVKKGWPEGAAMAREIATELAGRHATQRRRTYSAAGGSVNVGRLLASNPKHMISRPKRDGKRIMTLIVDSAMLALITADNFIIRAGIIAAIADILEANGYSCEIVNIDTANYGDKPYSHIVTTLKAAGEKMNIDDLVFALGHPSYLRRLCFACVTSVDALEKIHTSMGGCGVLFDEEITVAKNQFFIKRIDPMDQTEINDNAPLIDKALQIWNMITDDTLPISINREDQ